MRQGGSLTLTPKDIPFAYVMCRLVVVGSVTKMFCVAKIFWTLDFQHADGESGFLVPCNGHTRASQQRIL